MAKSYDVRDMLDYEEKFDPVNHTTRLMPDMINAILRKCGLLKEPPKVDTPLMPYGTYRAQFVDMSVIPAIPERRNETISSIPSAMLPPRIVITDYTRTTNIIPEVITDGTNGYTVARNQDTMELKAIVAYPGAAHDENSTYIIMRDHLNILDQSTLYRKEVESLKKHNQELVNELNDARETIKELLDGE